MATIHTRLTSDNKQHDDAFRRSRQEVYNYQKKVDSAKDGMKNFVGGITGKLIPALGLAGGAMGVFNAALKSNDIMNDKFTNAMNGARASVKEFLRELTTGSLDGFAGRLKDIRKEAEELSSLIDGLGTKKTVYNAEMTRLRSQLSGYKVKQSNGTLTDADKVAMKKIEDLMKSLATKMYNATTDVQQKQLDLWRKSFGSAYGDKLTNEKLLRDIKGVSLGTIDVDQQIAKNSNYMEWKYVEGIGRVYSGNNKQIKANYDYWTGIKSILDTEEFNNFFSIISEGYNYLDEFNKTASKTERIINSGTGSGSGSAKNLGFDFISSGKFSTPGDGAFVYAISDATQDAVISTNLLSDATDRYCTSLENVLETANELYPALSDKLSGIAGNVGDIGRAFSDLGNAIGDNGKALNVAGIITQAIANVISGYATASAQSATAGPIAWAGFSVAGLAQIASVISQIHNLSGYATGGIVGGSSYHGDNMLARVNSGEMILNGSQQANLWSAINSGGIGGGSVSFRISGSDLVGVLNNYSSKTGRVR